MNSGPESRRRKALRTNPSTLHFNDLLDAVVAVAFLVLVTAVVSLSVREWILLLARRKAAVLHETPPVWLPDYAVVESKPFHLASLLAVAITLAKELSGEGEMEGGRNRSRAKLRRCEPAGCVEGGSGIDGRPAPAFRFEIYAEVAERTIPSGVKRCC